MKISCLPPSSLPCFTRAPQLMPIRSRLSFLTENNAKYSRELEAAIDVVQRACRLCVEVQRQIFSKDRGILEKGDRTPVTVADFGVQALISLELSRLFPYIPLVAEEDSSQLLLDLENSDQNGVSSSLVEAVMNAVSNSSSLQAESLNHDKILKAIDRGGQEMTFKAKPATYWVLDPIDGTRGFVRGGKALYVVGLALVVEGRPILGVMGCPNWDAETVCIEKNLAQENTNKYGIDDLIIPGIIMAACHGCGTWIRTISNDTRNVALDGSPNVWVRCSVDKCNLLQEARFCIADRATWELLPLSKTLEAASISKGRGKPTIVPTCCGSLCKYLMVATGRASIFLLQVPEESSVKLWDHAVGMICVFEAGGEVTDWDGSKLALAIDGVERRSIVPRGGGILVTNGTLHNELLHMI
uniref:TSA: Wollemia nobilis Ref_Wollemi_Transcript_5913_1554 transcribed RNA sequence n=1 Tax=Wollemia nobilis TaxID=56998 RepID=A0A0C9S844_9CONI